MGKRQLQTDNRHWLVRWMPFGLAFTLFMGIAGYTIQRNYERTEEVYLSGQTEAFQTKLDTTMNAYQRFSDYVFSSHVNLPAIRRLMNHAVSADDAEREALRAQLLFALQGTHQTIGEYDFRQLHFHLPNGDSFMRFHAPELYGDNLFDVRASIRQVNQKRRPVSGFEEGRIFNGYRFVYPLFDGMTHVGSVEVSVSMTAVVRNLMEQYPGTDIFFAMDQQVVETTVFGSQQNNYGPSLLGPGLLADLEVEACTRSSLRNLDAAAYEALFCEHAQCFSGAASASRGGYSVLFQGEQWVLEVLPLHNLEDHPVGLLVAVQADTLTAGLRRTRNTEFVMLFLFSFMGYAASMMIQRDRDQLKRMAQTDLLTGLYNRKGFQSRADEEWARAVRYGRVFSLLLFDIDHFKRVNDRYGHAVGDEVLREVSRVMCAVARKSDVMFRWGGEEFLVLLPETAREAAGQAAEKFRRAIEEGVSVKGDPVTVSVGVATWSNQENSFDTLAHAADEAMYRAKEEGRNRVCMAVNESTAKSGFL
jgi:diguanylate cyclase (GGDEF)-like protein